MIPIFVRGHLSISVPPLESEPMAGVQIFAYENQNISVSGVTGLPWTPPLQPELYFGKKVEATIRIPGATPKDPVMTIRTSARILREQTQFARHMGLRFQLQLAEARNLADLISRIGYFPTEYLRKYPRIPSLPMIQTFPLKVIDLPDETDLNGSAPVSFDVMNLSPNGILISSESPLALDRDLGSRMRLVIEPRGWFPIAIRVEGMVCRILDETNEASGNTIRALGIKFTKIDPEHQVAFHDLLRDIVERVRQIGQEKASSES